MVGSSRLVHGLSVPGVRCEKSIRRPRYPAQDEIRRRLGRVWSRTEILFPGFLFRRVTTRGGVRSGSISKSNASVSVCVSQMAFARADAPFTVVKCQVKARTSRQCESSRKRDANLSASFAASAAANLSSQSLLPQASSGNAVISRSIGPRDDAAANGVFDPAKLTQDDLTVRYAPLIFAISSVAKAARSAIYEGGSPFGSSMPSTSL